MNSQDCIKIAITQAKLCDINSITIKVNGKDVVIQNNTLLKIILVNQFICDFVYACQCIWIFSLLNIYYPSKIVATIIWIVPFLLSNLVRPYIIRYAKTIPLLLKIVISSYVLIVFGQYLIIVSTEPQRIVQTNQLSLQYKVLTFIIQKFRILIAFIGWFLTKISLETIYNLNDQISAIVIYNGVNYDLQEIDKVSIIAKLNAYLLCAVALIRVFTYRNYYCSMSQIFYVCSLLCLTGAALMHNFNNFKTLRKQSYQSRGTQLQSEKVQQFNNQKKKPISQSIKQVYISISKWVNQFRNIDGSLRYDYFRGFHKIFQAPIELKLYLSIIAFANIILILIPFYSVMWVVQSLGKYQTILNYKYGLQIGSITLCLFFISTYYMKQWIYTYFRYSKESKFKRIIYELVFILITIAVGLTCLLFIQTNSTIILCISILLCSVLLSNLQVFLQNDQYSFNRFHPQFQICQNATFRISNFVSLFGIPIYLNFISQASNNSKALYFIAGITAILLVFKLYFLTKVQKKQKKQNQKQYMSMDMNKSQFFDMGSSIRSFVKEPMSARTPYLKAPPLRSMQSSFRPSPRGN